MRDLIERLEKATGPDRELDEKIAFITQFRPTGGLQQESFELHEAKHDYQTSWIAHAPFRHSWQIPAYTGSIDAAVALVKRVLPGWGWMVATCCVSDDAWVFPDFNSPEHGERLRREFREDVDWVDMTDVDLRPPGRPAIALLIALLRAKEGQ